MGSFLKPSSSVNANALGLRPDEFISAVAMSNSGIVYGTNFGRVMRYSDQQSQVLCIQDGVGTADCSVRCILVCMSQTIMYSVQNCLFAVGDSRLLYQTQEPIKGLWDYGTDGVGIITKSTFVQLSSQYQVLRQQKVLPGIGKLNLFSNGCIIAQSHVLDAQLKEIDRIPEETIFYARKDSTKEVITRHAFEQYKFSYVQDLHIRDGKIALVDCVQWQLSLIHE